MIKDNNYIKAKREQQQLLQELREELDSPELLEEYLQARSLTEQKEKNKMYKIGLAAGGLDTEERQQAFSFIEKVVESDNLSIDMICQALEGDE